MDDSEKIQHRDYTAKNGRISAQVSLDVATYKKGLIQSYDWKAEFYTEQIWQKDKEGMRVTYRYKDLSSAKSFFDRLTSAAKGIEMMLAPVTGHSWNAESAREVIGCIIQLEEQVKGFVTELQEQETRKMKEEGFSCTRILDYVDGEAE
ncbi:hypothetical protein J4402_01910 [Candidatus Pacearchaeota archaeon]|nr:hypothetical protein [uncultured archaeon]AQS31819.1 hypothetical protein [uncultured archaeon]MBS3088514.1 hypothetical protein [Candidatus Pacearchaeota archaeon]